MKIKPKYLKLPLYLLMVKSADTGDKKSYVNIVNHN